jgi:hypothetical protein
MITKQCCVVIAACVAGLALTARARSAESSTVVPGLQQVRHVTGAGRDFTLTPLEGGIVLRVKSGEEIVYEGALTDRVRRERVPLEVERALEVEGVRLVLGEPETWEQMKAKVETCVAAQRGLVVGRDTAISQELPEARDILSRQTSDLTKALAGLVAAEDATGETVRAAPKAFRETLARAKRELEMAQNALTRLLTIRHEADLVLWGLLEVGYEGPPLVEEGAGVPEGAALEDALARLRKELGVRTEGEWDVIRPRLQEVLVLERQLRGAHRQDPLGLRAERLGGAADDPLATAAKELARLVMQVPRGPDAEVRAATLALRDARQKVQARLAEARAKLLQVVTYYQENVLLRRGIVE